MLLHLGVGFDRNDLGRPSVTPNYNACANLGLCSAAFQSPATFPEITGLFNSQGGGFGSASAPLGPPGRTDGLFTAVNSIASLTWVRSNHTFKYGASLAFQGFYNKTIANLQGTYGFAPAETAMPYLPTGTATAEHGGAGTATANNPFGPSPVPGLPVMTWGQGVTENGVSLTAAYSGSKIRPRISRAM